jgi:hypothetical protein
MFEKRDLFYYQLIQNVPEQDCTNEHRVYWAVCSWNQRVFGILHKLEGKAKMCRWIEVEKWQIE